MVAFTMMGTVASQVTATGTILKMLGSSIGITYEMGACIACAVFIIYTATSGLFGVVFIALYMNNAYNILMFAWSFYAASAGIPAFAALFWKKATKQGIIAAMLGGFVVCVGWKLAGEPFGLGSTVPGAIVCLIALITVSLATCKKSPSVFLESHAK